MNHDQTEKNSLDHSDEVKPKEERASEKSEEFLNFEDTLKKMLRLNKDQVESVKKKTPDPKSGGS